MSDACLWKKKSRDLFALLCEKEWNPYLTGVIVAFFSVMIMAWWRPWGAVGAIRNWGDWFMYGLASVFAGDEGFLSLYITTPPKGIFVDSGSVIGLFFVLGAFISACLGKDFALRVPPYREMVKAVIAGILMGIGATLAGGCNVGGFYNAVGNLAANGFAMMFGLFFGVILGLKLLYMEMEHITWGSGGSKTVSFSPMVAYLMGSAGLLLLAVAAYSYSTNDESNYISSLGGVALLAAAIGYSMQRGRWCMVQGFREPHMTGDCTLAKSVMLSIVIVAIGAAVLKYNVPVRMAYEQESLTSFQEEAVEALEEAGVKEDIIDDMEEPPELPKHVLASNNYVRGTFGWGGVVGGFVFGLGAMFAGGCGSGTLWRVGEGQVKLMMVVPFFAVTSSIMTKWFRHAGFEADGVLGRYLYLPDYMGYGSTLILITVIMIIWYIVVTWNEESNKLIVPM